MRQVWKVKAITPTFVAVRKPSHKYPLTANAAASTLQSLSDLRLQGTVMLDLLAAVAYRKSCVLRDRKHVVTVHPLDFYAEKDQLQPCQLKFIEWD